jgi:hypothetical protein
MNNEPSRVSSALDDKIEQNRRTARALERLARAIFRAWFVDFEPVKAKAAGATAFPSMPQPVFDALPARFVDSEIGPVPEGWEVKAIGDVVTTKGGGTPSTKNPDYWDGGEHCWATPKDMSRLSHPVLLDTERRITDLACRLRSTRASLRWCATARCRRPTSSTGRSRQWTRSRPTQAVRLSPRSARRTSARCP